MSALVIALLAILAGFLFAAVRILPEYQRGVIFRLGRAVGVKGPGLFLLIPLIDKMTVVSLRTVVLDIPPQDIITRDNVTIKVNAVNYFRVVEPMKSVVEVEDFMYATTQLAQTTLRSVLGEVELDELLSKREELNQKLQEILDAHTDNWGIKVAMVELKDVDLPKEMQRVMGKQAEAERERRAKVISAQGEEMAAQHLLGAAQIISKDPVAVQIRFLQSIKEIPTNGNATMILPIPVDLISSLMKTFKGKNNDQS